MHFAASSSAPAASAHDVIVVGRGANGCATALGLAQAGLKVAEYAPNQVKKSVVGSGHAEKAQIRLMVKVLLPKAEFRTDDMADALAIAICHAHNRGIR